MRRPGMSHAKFKAIRALQVPDQVKRARRFRDRNRPSEKRDASPDSRHHLLFPCPIGSRLPYRMREIIFDTETKGPEPRAGHRLVEIGCIEVIDRRESGRPFHAYFHPKSDMPANAEAVHGPSIPSM